MQVQVSMATNISICESFFWSLGNPGKSEGKFKWFLSESDSLYGREIWSKLVNKVPLWVFCQGNVSTFWQEYRHCSVLLWCLRYRRISGRESFSYFPHVWNLFLMLWWVPMPRYVSLHSLHLLLTCKDEYVFLSTAAILRASRIN